MATFVKFDFVSREDTEKFGKNQENRTVNRSHVKNLKEQIKDSLDVMPPITINTLTNHVIDGQHRLIAFQELYDEGQLDKDSKIKVMFMEIPVEEEKQTIINANTNSKNWSLDDYIVSYVKAGLVSYKKLDTWCKEHAFTVDNRKSKFRYGAAIITGKRCSNDLKEGTFTFTDEELKRADEVHAEMVEISDVFGLQGKGAWIEALAVSWISVRERHSFKEWIRELKCKRNSLMKLPKQNSKDWTNIFAQVHLAIDKKSEK